MIGTIPGGPATCAFTGPNVGNKGLTLTGTVKINKPGVTYTKKDDVQDVNPRFQGKFSHGMFKITGVTDRDVDWVSDIRAEECKISFVNGRQVVVNGCILAMGDANFERDYTVGDTEELTFHFNDIAEVVQV